MFRRYVVCDRLDYVKKIEKTKKCFICEMSKGNKEYTDTLIYENKLAMVILNSHPYSVGHLLVAPKRHVVRLEDLTDAEYDEIFRLLKGCIKLLKKTHNPPAMNFGANIGGDIGGGSVLHFHMHVIPRYPREHGFLEVTDSTKIMVEPMEKTMARLKKHAKMLEK